MPRIIYLYPFPKEQIAGGIKVGYQHVALLQQAGYDAAVFQPSGRATWFDSTVEVISGRRLVVDASDIVVIPEGLASAVPLITNKKSRIFMFCQNHHYIFHDLLDKKSHFDLGIEQIYCCAFITKRFLERVFSYDNLEVIPYYVDHCRFAEKSKTMRIAFMPRKLPRHAELILEIFKRKYPEYREIPWHAIDNVSEDETAKVISESAVFLALGYQESFGLPPLEAMAAGCAVVGFHGQGGLEYASKDNGIWLFNDEVEEAADGLYRCLKGLETGDSLIAAMVQNGKTTAKTYDIERTRDCLLSFFARVI